MDNDTVRRVCKGDYKACVTLSKHYLDNEDSNGLDTAIQWMHAATVVNIDNLPMLIDLLKKRNSAEDQIEISFLLNSLSKKNKGIAHYLLSKQYTNINLEKSITLMKMAFDAKIPQATIDLVDLLIKRGNTTDFELIVQLCEKEISNTDDLKEKDRYLQRLIKLNVQGKIIDPNFPKAQEYIEQLSDTELKNSYLFDIYKYLGLEKEANEKLMELLKNNKKSSNFRRQLWNLEVHKYCPPIDNNDVINIMIVSSNEYAKYAAVLIRSVIDNNNVPIHFFIISNGMRQFNKAFIQNEITGNNKCTIIDYDLSLLDKWVFPNNNQRHRWSNLILCRAIPHLILPNTVNRVLSLGVDTTVDGDITGLYNIELNNKCVAATLATSKFNSYCEDESTVLNRINGDVILFDLKEMRKRGYTIDDYMPYTKTALFMDEHLIPCIINNDFLVIDNDRFNFRQSVHTAYTKNNILPIKPSIVQYIGALKPWHFYNDDLSNPHSALNVPEHVNDLFKIWWKYAGRCQHYEDLYADLKIIRNSIEFNGSKS